MVTLSIFLFLHQCTCTLVSKGYLSQAGHCQLLTIKEVTLALSSKGRPTQDYTP